MSDSSCWWCGAESTRLCDAMIGCERRESDGTLIIDEAYTCDAPLCDACTKQVGHVSGKKPDSMDMCPEHAGRGLGYRLDKLATSADESEKLRRSTRAKAWRAQMRAVKATPASGS